MMKVKICGQTSLTDCEMAMKHGADFVGVVINVDWSPRSLNIRAAQPIFDKHKDHAFLLTYNMDPEPDLKEAVMALKPYALQLTGQESPSHVKRIKDLMNIPVFKSIHLKADGESNDDAESILTRMEEYKQAGADGYVLDTAAKGMFGGTGVRSDWSLASKIASQSPLPLFLAGGINPSNVGEAVCVPDIYGVDLASGVEYEKGKKSEDKIAALFASIASATAP
jgi:phosphoribosylanthranilate isomerase